MSLSSNSSRQGGARSRCHEEGPKTCLLEDALASWALTPGSVTV